MNWREIINNSELVYASAQEDKHFRTWSLKTTTCNVKFYESYPIEDIDTIICSILEKSAGEMLEEELATVLGFNVINNFDVSPKRYADNAEFHVFQGIIKPNFDWGLIERTKKKEKTILKLTSLGSRALQFGEKYKFYSGKKELLENENIKSAETPATLFFPFYTALGESTEITNKSQIRYEEIKFEDVFDIVETDLIKQHKLQSKQEYNIYYSEQTKYFDFRNCQIDIRLFKQGNEYLPAVFYNNQVCIEATELLNHPNNSTTKDKKTEWGLYLKLLKDPNIILEYNIIAPFEDLINIDSLIKDTRLIWEDKKLFQFIADKADANQWFAISNHCPIEIIKLYIQTYKDNWDWTSLSLRFDNEFIIKNAINYPWNYEIISSKESISIEAIKTLLLIPELKQQEWDWDIIMPQLDFDFIRSNLDKIDFELSELTTLSGNDVKSLIAQYPDKKWDWIHISDEYELSFILDNILSFRKYIQIKKILHRAFTSEKYVNLFCSSSDLEQLLVKTKGTELRDYSANQAEYLWSPQLIDLLERNNLLTWESGTYTLGFECNPHIKWTYDYFEKYHAKVTTSTGFSFISKAVSDTRIVNDFLSFNWDWDIISTNPNLINDQSFVLQIADDKLNYTLLIELISGDLIEELFEKSSLLKFLSNNLDSWQVVTKKCSVEFVRKHINYEWDWSILTKRFCSTINIEALGNPKWIDKWDWDYLTRNLKLTQIYANIDSYVDYWDWIYLTEKTDKEFIINNLHEYLYYWDWQSLLNVRLEKSDLLFTTSLEMIATCISKLEDKYCNVLWEAITQKFDYNELKTLIEQSYLKNKIDLFQWDYQYFYSLSQFNVRQYLSDSIHLVDWPTLSSSKALNNAFYWDKSLFSYAVWCKYVLSFLEDDKYQWDFKGLSQLDSINWNETFLKVQTEKWDWDYLSEFSGCFRKSDKLSSRFRTFARYINYRFLSKRTDSEITVEFISNTINKNWDWGILSENKSINFTLEFIRTNKDRQWNWDALSIRKDIDFNNETLIELSDKAWNWNVLSTRNDIIFNNETLIELSDKGWNWEEIYRRADITFEENLIEKISDKPLDWFAISRNSTFEPSAKVLSLLKGKSLDWDAISRSSNLSADILWDYRDNFNWKYITKKGKIDISDLDILKKYENYVDWTVISQSEKFALSIKNLICFKDKLVWNKINERLGGKISEEYLELFADVLNWSNISKSMELTFTEDLIETYREYWDWQSLRDNPQVKNRLNTTLQKYKTEFNSVYFLEKFDTSPYIYHFTHLFNAIDIIKSRKILSRNKAEGHFSNSAGNLVARRSTAHNFARFYFRAQTPTQFYNECLGWDSSLKTSFGKSYYLKACNLGLPKCPIPIFFKFDLKEVLMKMYDKCFYSTGNMQTDRAKVVKIADNPNMLQMNYLYNNLSDAFGLAIGSGNYNKQRHNEIINKIKEYSQQEFLIEEEFDFSTLDSFEIICYNEEYVNLLKAQLGNDPICDKITSDSTGVFHKANRQLNINETETEIHISSEYKDNAYISIQGQDLHNIQILNPDNIKKETATEILAYPEIRFIKTDKPIKIHFVDLAIGKREWLIYKN